MVEQNTSGRKKATVAGVAVVGLIAAAGMGAGLNALFTDTKNSEPAQFQTGNVSIDLLGNDQGFDFQENLTNFAAGDTTYRFFTVKNAGSLDVGRLQARMVSSGDLSDKGRSDVEDIKQVNGDSSVGEGNTPLHMKITACVDGGQWTTTESNTDGTEKMVPTCSTGEGEEVFSKNEFANNTVSVDGIDGLVPMNAFAGNTSADTVGEDGANVTLFDVRETAVDADNPNPEAEPAKDEVESVGNGQRTLLAPDEDVAYMVTYHLPSKAKNEYQNTDATMRFFVTATQRDGKAFDAKGELATR